MSLFRVIVLLALISLLSALALIFLASFSGYEKFTSGYAVLTLDESIDCKKITALLESEGHNFGGSVISESNQWVYLDTFGSLEKIPLDVYFNRVNEFDPRNDGYAEKLKKLFISGNKKLIYIPLKKSSMNTASLNTKFDALLNDIPFYVEYYGQGEPVVLFFLVYFAASAAVLILNYIYRKTYNGISGIITLILPLSSLAFFGAPGVACAALFLGFFIFYKEPFNEFAALKIKKINIIQKEIIKPYRLYWYVLPVFLAAFSAIVVFSALKVLFLLAVFAVSVVVFFISNKIMHMSGRRFTPVMIIKKRIPQFAFTGLLIPFAAAVFFAIMLIPFIPGQISGGNIDVIVEEQEYLAHLAYQSTFSTRQLGTGYSEFPVFGADKDGLPVPVKSERTGVNYSDFPPFPLKSLMEFFNGANTGKSIERQGGVIADKVPFLILLFVIIAGLIVKAKADYPVKNKIAFGRIYSV